MKKFYLFSMGLVLSISMFAQTVTLTFTGRDANNNWVQLDSVTASNLTRGWTETLYWPDTVLTMQVTTGIDDAPVETMCTSSLQLEQNTPNPFSGTTNVTLTTVDDGAVTLTVMDMNGRTVAATQTVETHGRASLQNGTHQFRITVANAGTYILVARQNGHAAAIKMVNNGGGADNRIEYTGTVTATQSVVEAHGRAYQQNAKTAKSPKLATTNPFQYGDIMEYTGYATINGNAEESQHITQVQGASQTLNLKFDVTQLLLPTITTNAVTDIEWFNATYSANITADGGAAVIARGICWNTTGNPTIADDYTLEGSGIGFYTGSLTNLKGNTTYYVRAYATNSVGTGYGNEVSFTTLDPLPTVTTDSVFGIVWKAAACSGSIISTGLTNITSCGFCWSTLSNPTTADNSITLYTNSLCTFTCGIQVPNNGTTYYVRAFATNSYGTGYGNEMIFTTLNNAPPACPGVPTVSDIDGNVYNTVQIGNQCWMRENLKTTIYANNTPIAQGSTTSTTVAYWYYPDNNSSNKATYGLLYNWKAVMRNFVSSSANPSGVQGICPTGWHVPSDAEWTQLTDYVSSQSQYRCGSNSIDIAKSLAGTTGWASESIRCAVGNTPSSNNATGFSALPAGYYDGSYYNFGGYANFWSSTEYISTYANSRDLSYSYSSMFNGGCNKGLALSVRCVKD